MLTSALRSKIHALWDKFWSGGLSNPLTAIEQISYLLFMKRLDEMDLKNKADAEWLKKDYVSIFGDHEEYRWSRFKHLEGGEMLKLMQEEVFSFIRSNTRYHFALGPVISILAGATVIFAWDGVVVLGRWLRPTREPKPKTTHTG